MVLTNSSGSVFQGRKNISCSPSAFATAEEDARNYATATTCFPPPPVLQDSIERSSSVQSSGSEADFQPCSISSSTPQLSVAPQLPLCPPLSSGCRPVPPRPLPHPPASVPQRSVRPGSSGLQGMLAPEEWEDETCEASIPPASAEPTFSTRRNLREASRVTAGGRPTTVAWIGQGTDEWSRPSEQGELPRKGSMTRMPSAATAARMSTRQSTTGVASADGGSNADVWIPFSAPHPVDDPRLSRVLSGLAYQRQTQKLEEVRQSLLRERERSQQLLLAERSRIKEQWRRKTERSPFLVNLIAQTERQEEEMRLRQLEEERRAKLVESRKSKVKHEIILRAIAEPEPLDEHKMRRAELAAERQSRLIQSIEEREQCLSPRSPRGLPSLGTSNRRGSSTEPRRSPPSTGSPFVLPPSSTYLGEDRTSPSTVGNPYTSTTEALPDDLEEEAALAALELDEPVTRRHTGRRRAAPPSLLPQQLQEDLRQQRLALSEAALARRREELLARIASSNPSGGPPPSQSQRR